MSRRYVVPYTARGSLGGTFRVWAESPGAATARVEEILASKNRIYLPNGGGPTRSVLHYLRKRERAAMRIVLGTPREEQA